MINSFPKINLALDILKRDKTGYHEIATVFHELKNPENEFFDDVTVEETDNEKIAIVCDNPDVPLDSRNTVYQAISLLKGFKKKTPGVRITIIKRIPVMGGLGGGSSNAVAVLKFLGEKWGADRRTLKSICTEIGMDCAFFFDGGCGIAGHYGEQISRLPTLPSSLKFGIIDTGVKISTASAYEKVDLTRCGKNKQKTEKLVEAIVAGDVDGILENLHNDFEEFIFAENPELRKIKEKMSVEAPGARILLCGSGGCLVKISI